MKSREDAAKMINEFLDRGIDEQRKNGRHHFGRAELRDLMDFIYEHKPSSKQEMISSGSKSWWNR